MDIMIHALRARRHPAARIAIHLEGSPVRPRTGTVNSRGRDPVMRPWAASCSVIIRTRRRWNSIWRLSSRMPIPAYAKPRLHRSGESATKSPHARHCASQDPVAFVRAYAARALGELDRADAAEAVAVLLGDTDWWVRHAAKQSLERWGRICGRSSYRVWIIRTASFATARRKCSRTSASSTVHRDGGGLGQSQPRESRSAAPHRPRRRHAADRITRRAGRAEDRAARAPTPRDRRARTRGAA